jgi:hypothetical protein
VSYFAIAGEARAHGFNLKKPGGFTVRKTKTNFLPMIRNTVRFDFFGCKSLRIEILGRTAGSACT